MRVKYYPRLGFFVVDGSQNDPYKVPLKGSGSKSWLKIATAILLKPIQAKIPAFQRENNYSGKGVKIPSA